MDEREKRDAEINAALKGIESLINPPKTDDSLAPLDNANDDEIEELLALVGTSDVRVAKNIHINDRVEFAAQIEEIESKVTDDQIDHAQLDEAELEIDARMPKEGRERFLRARCRVLQEEVTRLQKELQTGNDKYHAERRKAQENGELASKTQKTVEKQRKELEKTKLTLDKEAARSETSEKRVMTLKRELDELKQKNKKQQKSSQNDVRLQRALADVQKYKDELQDALRQRKELGNVARHEATELEMEKNKTRKINGELKSIIQKQSKLVEVLRKKCAHLEAARVLEFTEDEFMKALDWAN